MRVYSIYILILVFSQNSYSQTQDELNFKWCDKLSFTQSVLDTVVNNLKRIYADDENFINSFNIAQRNWQILLESDMEMYMPTQEYWGSSETMCECQFKEQLLNNRIRFLKKWTQPGERKGWICGGTIIFENEEILIIDGERY